MNAPILTKKRCTSCLEYFPATTEFFHHDEHAKSGLRSRCRSCRYHTQDERAARTHKRSRAIAAEVPYVPGPKPCALCCDMPWRVAGIRCALCKLQCAQEPKPDPQLRRFDRTSL